MILTKNLRHSLVYYDEFFPNRWLDAVGPNVRKYILGPGAPCDDATGDPTSWTVTVCEDGGGGDSTVVNAVTAGQMLLLTTDNADYDGVNMQLKGEAFKFAAHQPLYFGIKATISSATQSDLLVGLCETLTALINEDTSHAVAAANVEGVFFVCLDGATTVAAKTYKDGSQTGTADSATAMDTAAHTYEIYWDGTTAYFYLDSVLVTSVAADLPDGDLTPSICFRTGDTAAITMSVEEFRCIQVR